MNQPIIESFNWLTPELKVVDSGRNSVKIKGVALRSNTVSKNGRKYVDEELRKAARTWIGKPITINHAPPTKEEAEIQGVPFDPSKIVGHIEWMEHDDDGNLEYVGTVNKQPYVDMIRMYGRNPQESSIRGVSVQANFLHNLCPECKKRGVEKRFYDEPSFASHMNIEHFIKVNPESEPHGLLGEALSIVVAPRVPGVEGTTLQVMETEQHGLSQLLETVITVNEEKERMSNIGIRKEGHVAVGKTGVITEEKEKVQPKQETKEIKVEESKAKEEKMNLGEPCSPELKACVDDLIAAGHPEDSAWAICRSKLGETVALKSLPTIEKTVLVEQAGLSFDQWRKEGYMEETSAACVKETRITNENNQKITKFMDSVTEALNVLFANMTEMHTDLLGKIQTLPVDDTSWKKAFESLPKDDLGWKDVKDDTSWKQKFEELKIPDLAPLEKKVAEIKIPDIAPLQKRIDEMKIPDLTPLEKKIAEIKIPDIAPLEKKLAEIKMPDLEPLNREIALLKDTKPLDERFKKLEETIAAKTKELETLNAEFGKLKEMFLAETKEFRGLLDIADKKVVEVTQSNEEYRKKAEGFEAKQKEQNANKAKETADATAKMGTLETKVDNLADKLKPQFKGQAKEQAAKTDPGASNWRP